MPSKQLRSHIKMLILTKGTCQGEEDHFEETNTEAACLSLCVRDPDCNWYTYNRAVKLCYLFKTCPSIDEECSTCMSGEKGCKIGILNKLLVTTGAPLEYAGSTTEIIDIDNPESICEDYFKYPRGSSYGAIGGLLSKNRPFICGGNSNGYIRECFVLGNDTVHTTLTQARHEAASIVLGDGSGLFVTGGRAPTTNQSEYIIPGQEPMQGPVWPDARSSHCLVQLDLDIYMILGGRFDRDNLISTTVIYDDGDQTFTPGPGLNNAKFQMNCGVLLTKIDNVKVVIVAGGELKDDVTDEIESWIIGSSLDKFVRLDSTLPYGIGGAGSVVTPDQDSMIIVGGYYFEGNSYQYQDSLTRISCNAANDCQAEQMEQKLRIPRSSMVAMLVPNSIVNCTETK